MLYTYSSFITGVCCRFEPGMPSQGWIAEWRTFWPLCGLWQNSRTLPFEPDTGRSWWLQLESASPWTRFTIYFYRLEAVAALIYSILQFWIYETSEKWRHIHTHKQKFGPIISLFVPQLRLRPHWACLFCNTMIRWDLFVLTSSFVCRKYITVTKLPHFYIFFQDICYIIDQAL